MVLFFYLFYILYPGLCTRARDPITFFGFSPISISLQSSYDFSKSSLAVILYNRKLGNLHPLLLRYLQNALSLLQT